MHSYTNENRDLREKYLKDIAAGKIHSGLYPNNVLFIKLLKICLLFKLFRSIGGISIISCSLPLFPMKQNTLVQVLFVLGMLYIKWPVHWGVFCLNT